jgi:hypothetical protein
MTTQGFRPGYKPPTRRHRGHVITDIKFTPKGGPCWALCSCGLRSEAVCPEDLADDQDMHIREVKRVTL